MPGESSGNSCNAINAHYPIITWQGLQYEAGRLGGKQISVGRVLGWGNRDRIACRIIDPGLRRRPAACPSTEVNGWRNLLCNACAKVARLNGNAYHVGHAEECRATICM